MIDLTVLSEEDVQFLQQLANSLKRDDGIREERTLFSVEDEVVKCVDDYSTVQRTRVATGIVCLTTTEMIGFGEKHGSQFHDMHVLETPAKPSFALNKLLGIVRKLATDI